MGVCGSKDAKIDAAETVVKPPIKVNNTPVKMLSEDKVEVKVKDEEKSIRTTRIIIGRWSKAAINAHNSPAGESKWLKLHKSLTTSTSVAVTWMIRNDDWNIYTDEYYNPYFLCTSTGESSWMPPENLGILPNNLANLTVSMPSGISAGQIFTVTEAGVDIIVLAPYYMDNFTGMTAYLFNYHNEEAVITEVDATTAWGAFATVTNLDSFAISESVTIAHSILDEIAHGYFSNDLLFQISWAHKLHLLETAIKDCYLINGDYLDSSKYDNCNGIPRYSDGGLLQWWKDLVKQREKLVVLLASDHSRFDNEDDANAQMFSHTHQVSINLSNFDPNADIEEITRLVQRRHVVEKDIENLVSQALAITSITGGPTKESLETVKFFLQDTLSPGSSGDQMKEIQDEIEEFVSNALQARHKFVVDILINMTMLENELEALNNSINAFKIKSKDEPQVKTEEALVADDGTGMKDAVNALIKQSEAEFKNLEDSLLAEKERKKNALAERLAKKRKARIDELVNGNPPVTPEDAAKLVEEEITREETDEQLTMDKEIAEKLADFRIKSLNDIKKRSEEESLRLRDNLLAEKEKHLNSLKDRLAAKKKQKTDELAGQPASQVEGVLIALDEEYVHEVDGIENKFNEDIKSEQKAALSILKERFDLENERAKQAVQSQGDARKRALQARLEKKIAQRANELVNDTTNTLTVAQALSIASAEFEPEKAANENSIDLELKMVVNNNSNQVLNAMKDLQEKENNNLKKEMERVEEESKSKLQSRLELKRRKLANELAVANPSTNTEEIAKLVDTAMVQEGQVLASEEAAKVNKIKADLDANLNALNDDLKSKSTSSLGNLKGRLKKRNEKKNNEQQQQQQQIKLVHVDTVLTEIKNDTKVIVDRINRLSDAQVKVMSDEDRTLVQDMNERAKNLMLYTTIKENLSAGYKKNVLYYIKAIKELASSTPDGMLSTELVNQIHSPEFRNKCVKEAGSNILTRYKRDVDGTVESQLNERTSNILKLFESKTSMKKVVDSDMKVNEHQLDVIRSDLYKNIATIAGLYINVTDVLEEAAGAAAAKDEDEFFLEESDAPVVFGKKIVEWFQSVVASMKLIDDSSTRLYYIYFDNHVNILSSCNYSINIASYSYLVKAKITKMLFPIYLQLLQHCYADKTALQTLAQDVSKQNSGFAKLINDLYKTNYEAEVTATLQALAADSKYNTAELSDIIDNYSKCMVEYLATPYKSLRDTYQTVQSIGARGWSNASPNASPNSGINKQNTVSNMQNEAKQRENELLKSLDEKMEKKKKELTERLARRDKNKAKSDATNDSEVDIKELNDAFDEVKSMVMSSSTARIIDDINVDGLMKAIELKVTGELKTITSESLLKVQQVMEQKEEQSMVQKVLQQHSESAEALDVSLKVKKAQESQALKERLRKRKQAS